MHAQSGTPVSHRNSGTIQSINQSIIQSVSQSIIHLLIKQ